MADTKPKVEKEDHDEDKSEVLGNLVKVVVLDLVCLSPHVQLR